jgi:methionyl-tRNA formyltransferase
VRIVFFGYHDFGYEALSYLIESGDEIARVVTHRDDPSERIYFRSVAERARAAGIAVEYREDMKPGRLKRLVEEAAPDLIVSSYYRRMLPPCLLEIVPRGGVNLHGSLLPKYRGRCPLNWVLLHDELETGLTLHEMVAEPDAGAILAQRAVAIAPLETAATLAKKLTAEVRPLLSKVFPEIRNGTAVAVPQRESEATYFGGRRPEDGRIDWREPVRRIDCLVRAVTRPYPGAFSERSGRRLTIWAGRGEPSDSAREQPGTVSRSFERGWTIACGGGSLRIEELQWEGEFHSRHVGSDPSGLCQGDVLTSIDEPRTGDARLTRIPSTGR